MCPAKITVAWVLWPNKFMKQWKLLLCGCAALFVGACTSPNAAVNAVPAEYAQLVASADKTCQTDSDCAAVQKGCCPCAGYEAVNARVAAKLQKKLKKACGMAACTLEMCYEEITPKCVKNQCAGELKPMSAYRMN